MILIDFILRKELAYNLEQVLGGDTALRGKQFVF